MRDVHKLPQTAGKVLQLWKGLQKKTSICGAGMVWAGLKKWQSNGENGDVYITGFSGWPICFEANPDGDPLNRIDMSAFSKNRLV